MFAMPATRTRPPQPQRDLPGYQIGATFAGGGLYITLSRAPGAASSLEFRNPAIGNGLPYFRPIPTGAICLIASGSNLGTVNSQPFRLWIVGFDNGGGIALGAINCAVVSSTNLLQIVGLDESALKSATLSPSAGGAGTAGIFYAQQAVTSRPFRVLGFMDWSSGMPSAGAWTVAPDRIQIMTPGTKLPGMPIQVVTSTVSAADGGTTSTTYADSALTAQITLTARANVVEAEVFGSMTQSGVNSVAARIARTPGTTAIGNNILVSGSGVTVAASMKGLDTSAGINSIGPHTYTVQRKTFNVATTVLFPNGDTGVMAMMTLTELSV